MMDQSWKPCLMDLTHLYFNIVELEDLDLQNMFFLLGEVRVRQKYGYIFNASEMTNKEWWNQILLYCGSFTVIDQGLARCNHEKHHWQWCSFDKCPKVERSLGELNYRMDAAYDPEKKRVIINFPDSCTSDIINLDDLMEGR